MENKINYKDIGICFWILVFFGWVWVLLSNRTKNTNSILDTYKAQYGRQADLLYNITVLELDEKRTKEHLENLLSKIDELKMEHDNLYNVTQEFKKELVDK